MLSLPSLTVEADACVAVAYPCSTAQRAALSASCRAYYYEADEFREELRCFEQLSRWQGVERETAELTVPHSGNLRRLAQSTVKHQAEEYGRGAAGGKARQQEGISIPDGAGPAARQPGTDLSFSRVRCRL